VTDDGDGRKGDHREERRRRDGESAEAVRLASLAKIDAGQATAGTGAVLRVDAADDDGDGEEDDD
jgi:hypothetical protein